MKRAALSTLLLLLAAAAPARAQAVADAPAVAAAPGQAGAGGDAALFARTIAGAAEDPGWAPGPRTGPASFAATPADPAGEPLAFSFGRRRPRGPKPPPAVALGSERARILLRSLTVPGWGQATMGHRTSAAVFGLAETAIWGSFTAFRIQVAMREQSYLRSARLLAGIDLRGRDEEWRRIVGSFRSSDEYNLLVVARDAANLDYENPAAYRAYYEAHKIQGADAWSWASAADQDRYRGQRKDAQRAARRANTALAVAIADRIVSAVHAARLAGQPARAPRSWRFEVAPAMGDDALAIQMRVSARF